MAFAVGELGLRLVDFYDMPWCEFLLKSFAYHRIREDDWEQQRLLNYNVLISSSVDAKKLPEYDSFMKAKKATKVTDEAKELFRQRMREYNEQIKNK